MDPEKDVGGILTPERSTRRTMPQLVGPLRKVHMEEAGWRHRVMRAGFATAVLSVGIVAVAFVSGVKSPGSADPDRAALLGQAGPFALIRELQSIPNLLKKGLTSYSDTLTLPVVSSDVPGDEARHKALQKLRKVVAPLPNPILERSAAAKEAALSKDSEADELAKLSALRSDGILDLGEYLAAKAKVLGQQLQGNEAPIIVGMTNIEKQTDWNDLGGSKTQFLDRHSVDCFPSAVSAFKLERNGEKMRYFYDCAQGITWGPAVGVVTAENDGGGGKLEYLDRHNVECPQGTVIAQFKMNSKNDAHKISYSYNCIAPAVETKMACYDKSTSPTSADGFGFKTHYLDRQLVKCDDNQVMQRFHMVSNMAGNSLLYEYRCCNVQLAPPAAPTPEAAAAAKKAEEEAAKQAEEEAAKQKAASAAEEMPSTAAAVPAEPPAPPAPAETPGAAGPIVPGLLRVTVYKVDGFKKGLTSRNISPYVALQIGTDTQKTSWKENVR